MRIYTSPLGNFREGLLIADLIRNLLRKSPATPPIIQLLPGIRIKVQDKHSTYGRVKVKPFNFF